MAVCLLVGDSPLGTKPTCYARNIEIGGLIIFQAVDLFNILIYIIATLIINIIAIIMTFIMIWHVRTKYTAVGRREMIMVFYLYLALVLLDILTISGFIAFSNPVYPYFVAGYLALTSAMCWCLMLNGFIGFQWAEDGTSSSLWTFRLTSAIVFGTMYFVSIATFKNMAVFSKSKPIGIFTIYFIFNLLCLLVYVISQIILVVNTLDEYWPLGNICFAVLFFAAGQVIQLFLSSKICNAIKHYVDGLFFGTICTLLSVMMIYKYWDSITKEDLEFSVGGKGNVWEVKDYINPDDEFAPYAGQINGGAYGDNSANYGTTNTNQYMSGGVGPNNNNADYGIYSNDSNSYRNNQNTQQYNNY
ncbi:Chitin synthase export chaperone [Smittium culicis]|uniref:Chitin synthase export chaperone n=1 Tax=Smittium culicis TaxID=133412 RepID=A0A1R1XZC0_9FUNG|nr:Chitin synthase export chaperone [Smittium culicis]